MKSNYVRAKLKRGEPSVGTWLTLPDPLAAQLMARAGFDWLTVELEHTPVTFETAAQSRLVSLDLDDHLIAALTHPLECFFGSAWRRA